VSLVRFTLEDGVADVRLNRPGKMNALSDDMFDALIAVGREIAADRRVRAVVVSGEGRAFCAGLDTSGFSRMAGVDGGESFPANAPRTHGVGNRGQHLSLLWRDLAAPVIAAVHGVAFGAGLQIALGADIRYVAADAKLAFLELRWGLIPDMNAFALLRELMRTDVARELVYSARIVDGAEAVAIGLATRVEADPRTAAFATARVLAQQSPDALASAKQLFNVAQDSDLASLAMMESVRQDMLVGTPNQVEAVKAAGEKRAPKFDVRSSS